MRALCFKRKSHCEAQASFELEVILLPHLLSTGITDTCHDAQDGIYCCFCDSVDRANVGGRGSFSPLYSLSFYKSPLGGSRAPRQYDV